MPTPREKPPLRCHTFGCGNFAKTPERWNDDLKLVTFPECTPCRRKRERRDKRAAVLARNVTGGDR